MNLKLTVWLTALAVGLFGYIYFVEMGSGPAGDGTEQPGKVLPSFNPKNVTSVEITRSNQTIRAEQSNGQWRLVKPRYPAQTTVIESFLNALTNLQSQKEIPAQEIIAESGGLSPFGLDPPAAIIKLQADTNLIQLKVGGKSLLGDRVYVQPAGASGIFLTDASLLRHLPDSTNTWRNPMLLHDPKLSFDRIAIVTGGRPLTLEKDKTNQSWRLVVPEPIQRADFERVEYLIQQLRSARVSQFVSDNPKEDLESFGLQPPEAELTLVSADQPVFHVQFGRSPTNDPSVIYARRMSHTNVVLVPKEMLEWVAKPYSEFRDRSLLSFQPAHVDRIEGRAEESFALQRDADNSWRIVEPFDAPADRQLMQLFLNNLAALQVIRFEKDVVADFAPYGLVEPIRQYTLKRSIPGSAGSTNHILVQVDFGIPPPNELDKVFCRRSDESSVYVVAYADMFRLERAAFSLRDRRVWQFASSNVAAVTIVQRGNRRELVRDTVTRKWDRENAVNDAAIEEILHRLGELEAEVWVARGEQQAEKLGTANGKFDLILQIQDAGKRFERRLSFGSLSSSGQPYAAVTMEQGQPVVFKFPSELYSLIAMYLSVPSTDPAL